MTPKPRNPQALRFAPESIRGLLNVRVGTWPPEPIDPAKPCKWQTRRLVTQAHADRYAAIDPSHRDATIEDFCYVYEDLACAPDCDLDAMAQVLAAKLRAILRIRAGDVVYINEPVAFDIFNVNDKSVVRDIHYGPCVVLSEPADRYGLFVALPPRIKTPGVGRWPGRTLPIEWARPARFEVMDVRPERLQDITDRDVAAEGYHLPTHFGQSTHEWFYDQWNAINRKRGTRWADNPWVAAYRLKRIA